MQALIKEKYKLSLVGKMRLMDLKVEHSTLLMIEMLECTELARKVDEK